MHLSLYSTIPLLFTILLIKNCQTKATQSDSSVQIPPPSVSIKKDIDTLPQVFSMDNAMPKISGLSFVAPPRPFQNAIMNEVKAVNATWVACIPYAFTRPNEAAVHYANFGGHWWGESPEGVRVTIDSAHRAGIKVMLKPQVYVPGGWTGSLDYATDVEWNKWEEDYENYLMRFVDIGAEMNVESICIGTEFKIGAIKREYFWRNLIAKIRKKYKGQLTYSSNWDEYESIKFWDALDFVGINAYMPLLEKDTPSVSELLIAWKPYLAQIKDFQSKIKKPIAFTEYGYMSVDGCAGKGWEVEKKVKSLKINQLAQANAIEALLATFWNEPWWRGGFLWKWFPNGQGHEGYIERDYTPQNKKAADVLRKWYK